MSLQRLSFTSYGGEIPFERLRDVLHSASRSRDPQADPSCRKQFQNIWTWGGVSLQKALTKDKVQPMQDGETPEGHLRKMATKCRLMAEESMDEREAASLRTLAEEYDKAAEAVRETTNYMPPTPTLRGA